MDARGIALTVACSEGIGLKTGRGGEFVPARRHRKLYVFAIRTSREGLELCGRYDHTIQGQLSNGCHGYHHANTVLGDQRGA